MNTKSKTVETKAAAKALPANVEVALRAVAEARGTRAKKTALVHAREVIAAALSKAWTDAALGQVALAAVQGFAQGLGLGLTTSAPTTVPVIPHPPVHRLLLMAALAASAACSRRSTPAPAGAASVHVPRPGDGRLPPQRA